jgi:hypothetical protein
MTDARADRILGYLRACVEAEHAAVEYLTVDGAPAGSEPSLLLERGPVPLGDARAELAPSNRARRWAEARSAGIGEETLWVGWPVVRGHRRVAGRRAEVVAGLLIGQVELVADGGDEGTGAALRPRGHSVELGDEALDLLAFPSDERELLRRDFDRALNRGRGDTFAAAVRFLNARGITAATIDPRSLGPLDQSQELSNTAVAWVGRAAEAPSTRAVVDDLRRLAGQPRDELAAGPLGAVLALAGTGSDGAGGPAAPRPTLEPVAGVAPLDVQQEAAIADALSLPLSVVTAPAGLARTDLIANTVAAALVRGERVLVASTNDRALDVIHERLATANDWASPVRAGHDALRSTTAEVIDRALRREVDPHRAERYPTWWAVRADIEAPYEALATRRELTRRLEEVTRRRTEVEATLPGDVKAEGDAVRLAAALGPTRARAEAWASLPRGRPWHRRRVRTAERELDLALEGAFAALDGPVRELARLRLDTGDPAGALGLATTVLEVLEATVEITVLVSRLSGLPEEAMLEARIDESYPIRRVAAAQLHEDRWAQRLATGGRVRSNASLYRAGLTAPVTERPVRPSAAGAGEAHDGGDRAASRAEDASTAELHKLVPDVLELLPVWLVTTSAVGRWFPLTAGLFDLVIVDDAAHSDIASALPALARARRAMVVGDPHLLAPVSHVTTDLDAQLAGAHGLSEDDHRRFSHRRGSLFSLAAGAGDAAPAFLRTAAGVDPELVELVSGLWYGGRVHARAGAAPGSLPGPALRWVDHRGQFEAGRAGRSGRNASEALAVVDEVITQLAELRAAEEAAEQAADDAAGPDGAPTASHHATDSGGAAGGNGSGPVPGPDTTDAADTTDADTTDADAEAAPEREPAPGIAAAAGATGTAGAAGAAGRRRDLAVPLVDLRDRRVRSIGVVTPLAAQREALRDLLLERFGRTITVDTPDTFQGDERDVVIVSLVISGDTRRELVELVADDARLTVALSRARSRLVIVGDREAAAASGTRLAEVVDRLDHAAGRATSAR